MKKERQKVLLLPDIKTTLTRELFKRPIPEGIVVKQEPRTIVHHHSYGGLSPFFVGLAEGKLLGTRCVQNDCGGAGIWLPPRACCPDCWGKMDWVEVDTREARVYTYSTTNYPGAGFKATVPCPLISVEIPGVRTKFMTYLSEFGEGEPYIGMPVRPVFRTEDPTYSILDISWIPVN